MLSSRNVILVSVLLTALCGWLSVSTTPALALTSWAVFLLLALVLIHNQVRTPFPMLLSVVSAYYLFVGARFTISMIEISLTEGTTGLRVFSGVVSVFGVALVVVSFYAHFRQLKAIKVFFWVAIAFAPAKVMSRVVCKSTRAIIPVVV